MSHREVFDDFVRSSTSIFSADEISSLIRIYTGPCPEKRRAVCQRFYRIKRRYLVKDVHAQKIIYAAAGNSQNLLKVVSREFLFDLLEMVHTEGGKHLGRDRLFSELKQQYCGFSKEVVQVYI